MAGGKLTPRQKMINMMYLVLTALLAMNVSAEILNAFKTVNNSITNSNGMIDTKNEKVVKGLENERKNQPEKVAELMKLVEEIKSKSNETAGYIEGLEKELNKAENDADLEVGTHLLAEGKDGELLKQKLEGFSSDITKIMAKYPLPSAIPVDVTPPKTAESGQKLEWRQAYFHMVPKVAALTILNKFKNDVKTTEAMCLDRLAKEAVSVEVTLDKFEPLVSAKSSYVLVGDKYEATIGLGAYSTAIVPEVYVGGSRVEVKDGKATYTVNANSAGSFTVPTLVKIPKRSGGFEEAKGELKYEVGVPAGAAVMLDKMNVVYIGVDNPITVSSGSGAEKTSVTPSGGGMSVAKGAGPGKYIVKATTPDLKANLKVAVTGGKATDFPIRVKRIPDPVPTLGGKLRGGNAQPGTLKAQTGIVPVLDNFDFEARFNVESYDMVFASKGEIFRATASGPLFSPQMLTFISRAKPKDVIYLEEIKVRGPDGTPRKIGQIVFTVQ
ncbi:MAG: gliding motility protein GldM [Bacteroidetes bacterium]|nr:gliding motility protein GldM [Bacteroidota bacterium]